MYCVTVVFSLAKGGEAAFLPLVRDNAARSLSDEPGCLRFDVCYDAKTPSKVFLYELYTDRAAFDAHLSMAHFTEFDAATKPLVLDKQVVTYTEVWT